MNLLQDYNNGLFQGKTMNMVSADRCCPSCLQCYIHYSIRWTWCSGEWWGVTGSFCTRRNLQRLMEEEGGEDFSFGFLVSYDCSFWSAGRTLEESYWMKTEMQKAASELWFGFFFFHHFGSKMCFHSYYYFFQTFLQNWGQVMFSSGVLGSMDEQEAQG